MGATGQDSSNVNILALLFLLAMCFVVFRASSRGAIGAMLATAAFVPLGQQINLGGLHLYFLRLLILAGFVRLIARNEFAGFRMNSVDKLVLCWALVGLVCGLIRDGGAEIFGQAYNDLGTYFVIRVLMKDLDDPVGNLRTMAWLGIAVGISMSIEWATNRNPFYFLGGVPQIPALREGRYRCQGPFQHAILAGTFGASLFPLMVGLWQQRIAKRDRMLAVVATFFAAVITYVSASSGPLMTFIAAIIGFCLWPLRSQMRWFRRGCVAVIILMGMMMKAPVWFIIARISDLTGGGGFYRSELIDKFVNHFSEWWLIGTSYTANWATAGIVLGVNSRMIDITNHYIAQGIGGGLLKFILFFAILVACFKIAGRNTRDEDIPGTSRHLAWALGVCLACHCTAFISVSYFDQIQVYWFWLLAALASLPEQTGRQAEAGRAENAPESLDENYVEASPEPG